METAVLTFTCINTFTFINPDDLPELKIKGTGEIAYLVKCLPCNHEDLSESSKTC